jgi:hypothetical protein
LLPLVILVIQERHVCVLFFALRSGQSSSIEIISKGVFYKVRGTRQCKKKEKQQQRLISRAHELHRALLLLLMKLRFASYY